MTLAARLQSNTFTSISQKLIMHEDLNAANRLFGGRVIAWIDEAAALFAMTQLQTRAIVTKKFSEIIFNEPAQLGDVMDFRCRIKKVGTTSITVECLALAKDVEPNENIRLIVECDVVFVCIDRNGNPRPHNFTL